MIIVCLTCNITLPRRRGSRPDGARCCEVIKVIHVGPPDDCSDYIQQCGRASHRGEAASAVLLYNKFYNQTVEPEMNVYYIMAAGEITFSEILIIIFNLFVMVHAAVVICVNQFVLDVFCVLPPPSEGVWLRQISSNS